MASKLGVHSILPNRVGEFAQQLVMAGAHFPVVKAVDDIGWLAGIKQASPKTVTVGRFTGQDDVAAVHDPGANLAAAARAQMDWFLAKSQPHWGYVDYWEIVNEMDPEGPQGHARLAQLMIHCMDIAEQHGVKLALFSWAAGTPEVPGTQYPEELSAIVNTGVFARAKAGGHILALHEGTFGPPAQEGMTWLNCRYRFLYDRFLKPRNEVIPLVVSEWTIGVNPYDVMTAEEWAAQLAWYDSELSKDPYVIGVTPFTLGPVGFWRAYDYEPSMPHVAQRIIALKDEVEEGAGEVITPATAGGNLLVNPGFEGGWTRCTHTGVEYGEIFVPEGWVAFWSEQPGPLPHDADNREGYARPEMQVINREAPFLDPLRVRSGRRGLKYFTFSRIHDAGVYQHVTGIAPGTRLRASAWVHAWSNDGNNPANPHRSDGHWSDGEGVGFNPFFGLEGEVQDDAARNFTFSVGIDPAGGTDPWGGTVMWGRGAHIYNAFAQVPPVEAVAQGNAVTVFLRSKVLWRFRHNDAYWDDAELFVLEEEVPVRKGDPRVQYERTYLLLPPGADAAWARAVVDATWNAHRYTIGGSADDAGIGNLDRRRVVAVNPSGWPAGLGAFFRQYYPGLVYVGVTATDPGELAGRLAALGPMPAPPPQPPQPRGLPRDQYERTYVLLPPGADSTWALAVVNATWDVHRYTIGGSADDAGIGALDFRRAIAVNPGGWPGDLGGFFQEYYPGVQYSPVEAASPEDLETKLRQM